MKKIILILILISLINVCYAVPPTPTPDSRTLTIIDNVNMYNENKIMLYHNGTYVNTYNFSEPFQYCENSEYVIIIDEDYIDLIRDKSFFNNFFSSYGYLIMSLLIVFGIISLLFYLINKGGK